MGGGGGEGGSLKLRHRYISGRHGMHNRAVEHNVACIFRGFLCCTLAGNAMQRLYYKQQC